MQDVVQALTQLLQDGRLLGFAPAADFPPGEPQAAKLGVSKLGATKSGVTKVPPPPAILSA